jgi:hypothetical protein
MLEMTTGQKVPQMSGTIGEIQNSLVQIQASQSQILAGQQQLLNKLNSLENNTNNSFRLLATETKRSLELQRNGSSFNNEQQLMNNPHSQSIPES